MYHEIGFATRSLRWRKWQPSAVAMRRDCIDVDQLDFRTGEPRRKRPDEAPTTPAPITAIRSPGPGTRPTAR